MTNKKKDSAKEDRSMTRLILDSIADGVFTINHEGKITSFNRAAEQITGYTQKEVLGQYCHDIFKANICFTHCPLKHTARTYESIVNMDVNILNRQNQEIPISISTSILKDAKGSVIGGVETFRDLSLIVELRKELSRRYTCQDIVSRSKSVAKLLNLLPDIAESSATVLIQGESGTGKELFATAIHNMSPRKENPLIIVNCGALPEGLLESELFGYKKGAFTDAKESKRGFFELADGGTLFLDEVGELPPAAQVKLLRFLDSQVTERLGSATPIHLNVRVLAATNRCLSEALVTGAFRSDLYYRLAVIEVELPPLRKRGKDITELADHFITQLHPIPPFPVLSPDAAQILRRSTWPGNVRQLRNTIEHALVMSNGRTILPLHLPRSLHNPYPSDSEKDGDLQSAMNCLMDMAGTEAPNAFGRIITPLEVQLDSLAMGSVDGDRGRLSNFKDDGKTIRLSDPSVGFYEISWETSTKRKKDADRRDFVSGYAMTNVFEDFAESYLFYRLHGDKFRRIMSQSEALRKKYDFLKEKVFNGEEFQTDHTDTTFVHNTIWDATLLPLTHSELIISD